MKLGDKICELRKAKGWSQQDLADQLHISRQSISKWEQDLAVPDITRIIELCTLFEISTDTLLMDRNPALVSETEVLETEKGIRENVPEGLHLSSAQIETYQADRSSVIKLIRNGVGICMISVALFFLLSKPGLDAERSEAESSRIWMLALTTMIVTLIPAVLMFIRSGMIGDRYEGYEYENLILDDPSREKLVREQEQFRPIYTRTLLWAIGLMMGISALALLFIGLGKTEGDYSWSLAGLLVVLAGPVCMIIHTTMKAATYQILLQDGDYTLDQKKAGKKLQAIAGIYWIVVTVLYLGVSYLWSAWRISWLIWVAAGLIFGAIVIWFNAKEARSRSFSESIF